MMETVTLINEQIDGLFSDGINRELLRASERGTFPAALWTSINNLGLILALVPEQLGGAGLSWDEVSGVFELAGYHAAPVPIGETMIAAWALAVTGLAQPDGPLGLIPPMLDLDINSGAVTGSATNVAWAQHASHFVAIARDSNQTVLCLLSAAKASIEPLSSLGRDPQALVNFGAVVPVATGIAPAILQSGLQGIQALLRACQIAGALSRCLEFSIEYCNTRVQFGKPIAKFQAIQHMMAELACETAAAKVAAGLGLRSFGRHGGEAAIAAAKIRCGMAAQKGAAIAHAVHGAIGVTEEHILHYLTRRLWSWRDDAGSEHAWAERLGRDVLTRPGSALWPMIIGMSA